MTDTIFKWNNLHKFSRFQPRYPSEVVVQFVFQNFPNREGIKFLDLGAGAGRHTIFLSNEGYHVTASDVSESGINHIKKMALDLGLENISSSVNSADNLPFEDDVFDGCISFGVLYYMKFDQIEQAFDEIHRVLKKGGKAFIFIRTTDDHRFGKGKEIERNTFIVEEQDETKSSFFESGMTLHFFTLDEIRQLSGKFTSISIDRMDETIRNGELLESNFIIKVTK